MANSNPWLDEALRKRYRKQNKHCELLKYMEGEAWENAIDNWHAGTILEVHHLWSDHQRYDVLSNLIVLCSPVHSWMHAYPMMARTVCVWHKATKGEFDVSEMRRVLGRCPLGTIENYPADALEPWVQQLRDDLMEMF